MHTIKASSSWANRVGEPGWVYGGALEEVLGELTSDTLVSQMPKDDEGFLKESVGAGAGRGFGIKGGGLRPLRLVLPSQVMLSRPRAAKLIFYQPVKYFHTILDL